MSRFIISVVLFLFFTVALATVHYKEEFNTNPFPDRWVSSHWKESGGAQGSFEYGLPEFYGDDHINKGILADEKHRFWTVSDFLDKPFSNKGKDLVFQYEVKFEEGPGCGGGYVKLLPSGFDQKNFNGDTPYNVMFGPDFCGTTKRVHVIFNYKGQNFLIKKEISPKHDKLSHVYTLVVHPDATYEVLIDLESAQKGALFEDWDFFGAKNINDPSASKPKNWVDDKEINDPEDRKPSDWDQPKTITDPEAKKPADWDTELDGEWEAPSIDNPEYKGVWKAKRIPNPLYTGPWVHPQVPNPDYKEDSHVYAFENHGAVGIETWSVEEGIFYDNFFVGDSLAEAEEFAKATWGKTHEGESAALEAAQEKARLEREAAEKAAEEAKASDDDGEAKHAHKDEL